MLKLGHTLNKRPILDSCQVFPITTPKCFPSCHAASHLDGNGLACVLTAAKGRAAGQSRPCRETVEAIVAAAAGTCGVRAREQLKSGEASYLNQEDRKI